MEIGGTRIEGDLNTRQAQKLGVAIIHQELNMCQHLAVAANMFLGREITKNGWLDRAEMNRQAKAQLEKLGIRDLDPETIVDELTVGRQQMVEIAKALLIHATVLVRDEPSSSLSNKEGLNTKLSIRENIALPNLDQICSRGGSIHRKAEAELIDRSRESLSIKMAGPDAAAESLSGGNQQKVVVAKWLARNSRVIIFDEPTRGIDVAAKVEIYEIINDLKKRGIGVIVVSSEMPEVMGISGRILVMCDGRVTSEVPGEGADKETIMTYATQFEVYDAEQAV